MLVKITTDGKPSKDARCIMPVSTPITACAERKTVGYSAKGKRDCILADDCSAEGNPAMTL